MEEKIKNIIQLLTYRDYAKVNFDKNGKKLYKVDKAYKLSPATRQAIKTLVSKNEDEMRGYLMKINLLNPNVNLDKLDIKRDWKRLKV